MFHLIFTEEDISNSELILETKSYRIIEQANNIIYLFKELDNDAYKIILTKELHLKSHYFGFSIGENQYIIVNTILFMGRVQEYNNYRIFNILFAGHTEMGEACLNMIKNISLESCISKIGNLVSVTAYPNSQETRQEIHIPFMIGLDEYRHLENIKRITKCNNRPIHIKDCYNNILEMIFIPGNNTGTNKLITY